MSQDPNVFSQAVKPPVPVVKEQAGKKALRILTTPWVLGLIVAAAVGLLAWIIQPPFVQKKSEDDISANPGVSAPKILVTAGVAGLLTWVIPVVVKVCKR